MKKVLAFAAIAEIGTGLAILIDPALVVRLLAGGHETGENMPLARFPGITLVALGLACWPDDRNAGDGSSAYRGMLTYNVLVALFLVYLFVVEHLGGVLLWPGVALHAVVALLLVWTWRTHKATTR